MEPESTDNNTEREGRAGAAGEEAQRPEREDAAARGDEPPRGEPGEARAVGQDGNRQGRNTRRGRFGRNDRGRRPEGERPPGREEESPRGRGNIRDAMRHIEHLKAELRRVLDEMNEVVRILGQAEKDKTASDVEIERLRESLDSLQQDRNRGRYPRPAPRVQAAEPEREPAEAEETPERELD